MRFKQRLGQGRPTVGFTPTLAAPGKKHAVAQIDTHCADAKPRPDVFAQSDVGSWKPSVRPTLKPGQHLALDRPRARRPALPAAMSPQAAPHGIAVDEILSAPPTGAGRRR